MALRSALRRVYPGVSLSRIAVTGAVGCRDLLAREVSVQANTIRKRDVIQLDGDNNSLYRVREARHVKPGKGGAYLQVDLRAVTGTGSKQVRFRVSESVELVELEAPVRHSFLWQETRDDAAIMTLMDESTYEQVEMSVDLLGETAPFLTDGIAVDVQYFEGQPLSVKIGLTTVNCTIAETGPNRKKESDTDTGKPAVLDNGVTVIVPGHVMTGDVVEVRVEDLSFMSRIEKA